MHILFGPTQGATGPNGGQGPRGSNGDAVRDFKLHQLWRVKCDGCSSLSSQGAQGTRGAEGSKGEKGDLGVLGDRGPNGRNGVPGANVSPINHVLWPKFCPHAIAYCMPHTQIHVAVFLTNSYSCDFQLFIPPQKKNV